MKNETLKTGIVLAAGLGKRLRPFTNKIPKPLLVISDRTILDFGLERFIEADLETVVVNVHHLANQIKAHIKTKREKRIVISDETKALMEIPRCYVQIPQVLEVASKITHTKSGKSATPNRRDPCRYA